jgi:hypothetical protein
MIIELPFEEHEWVTKTWLIVMKNGEILTIEEAKNKGIIEVKNRIEIEGEAAYVLQIKIIRRSEIEKLIQRHVYRPAIKDVDWTLNELEDYFGIFEREGE